MKRAPLLLAALVQIVIGAGCGGAGIRRGLDAGTGTDVGVVDASAFDVADDRDGGGDGDDGNGNGDDGNGNGNGDDGDGDGDGDGSDRSDRGDGEDRSVAGDPVDASDARSGDTAIQSGAGGASGRTPADRFAGSLNLASFGAPRTGWASALATAGGVIAAVNPDSDSITVVDESVLGVVAEIDVGDDPRTLALTADARYAVVVNRGDATVSLVDVSARRELFYFAVGPMPYGVVLVGAHAYVTGTARGELEVLDIAAHVYGARIPLGDSPAGIAACLAPRCTLPGGDSLLVTHLYDGVVDVIDRARLSVTASIATGADTNLSQFIAISPDGASAYLPQTRSNVDNPNRQFDTTVFPVVNVVELAPLPATPSAATPAPRLLNAARITLDTADRPVGMPFAVDLSRDGRTLWVANAASDDLSVVDVTTQLKIAHVDVGANPRAVVLSRDGSRAYVNETLDGTLAIIDTATFVLISRLTLTRLPLDARTLSGKRIFHSARRTDLAKDRWMSCATCHLDGLTDRRTWRSFPDGPRNTTALFNLEDTLPMHWSGDLDEVQDVEATIRFIQAGTGLAPVAQIDTLGTPLADASPDLDDLTSFIRAIPAPRSPFTDDQPAITRGQTAFHALGCAVCHPAPRYTDRIRHDVGTGNAAVERNGHGRGTSYDTPSLRALWLTPPYLHDGTAATLTDVLGRGVEHDVRGRSDASTRADLVTFLRSL